MTVLQDSLFDDQPEEPRAATAVPAPAPTGALVVAATDGSCNPNPGAAAGAWFVSPTCYGVAPVVGVGTHNIGELLAIRALLEAVPAERPLEIVFDSTYARDCLTLWIKGWSRGGTLPPSAWRRGRTGESVKNAELIGATAALLVGRTVTWTKATAHVSVALGGHALNHEADRLAGDAVAAMRRGENPDLGPGFTD